MALKPLKGLAPEWFKPSSQEEEETPTRFKVKPLDSMQLDQAMEGATYNDKGELVDLSARGKVAALRYGLTDWENFDLKFSTTNFVKIPWVERQEIAMHIVGISILQEEEEKN